RREQRTRIEVVERRHIHRDVRAVVPFRRFDSPIRNHTAGATKAAFVVALVVTADRTKALDLHFRRPPAALPAARAITLRTAQREIDIGFERDRAALTA